MKHKTRKIISFISFLLFPVTLNFMSPYVSVDGALVGVVSGSVIVFIIMFLSGIFFRRAWCSYVCPWAMPSEMLIKVNDKTVNRKHLRIIRYSIFSVWFIVLVAAFILAGGIKTINPLHLTESGISVDEPLKYATYYTIVLLLFLVTLLVGKRGACHSICWMSPFLVLGSWVGEKLHLPQFKVRSEKDQCISCKKCDKVCPMSINVMNELQLGSINSLDCILCGECVDVCPKDVLSIKWKISNQ